MQYVLSAHSTYKHGSLLAERNLFSLQCLRLVVAGEDLFHESVFLLMTYVTTFFLDMSLKGQIARVDESTAFLNQGIFCLYFFEKVCNLCGKVCYVVDELLEHRSGVFGVSHIRAPPCIRLRGV